MASLSHDDAVKALGALQLQFREIIDLGALGRPWLQSPTVVGDPHQIHWAQVPGWVHVATCGGWSERLYWALLSHVSDEQARKLAYVPPVTLPRGVGISEFSDTSLYVYL